MSRSKSQIAVDRERLLGKLGRSWKSPDEIDAKRKKSLLYGDLRWLEDHGLIESRKVESERMLYFCVRCGSVMTSSNYECEEGGKHDIRPFRPQVKQRRLTAAGVRALQKHELLAA